MSVFPGIPDPSLTDVELRASPVPAVVNQPVPVTQATPANLKGQAQLIDSSGTAYDYAQVGTAGTPATDVVTVQGISGGTVLPVSASSLPLPSGAATSANQTTANSSLSSIDSKLPSLASGRVPVDIGGSGSITITSGTVTVSNEVEVTNSTGNPIPVSGPLTDAELRATAVPVSGTFWQATQPVSVASALSTRVAGWDIPVHDHRDFGYTSGNLTSITYKTGGAGGTTVATLTLGYDGSGNLVSMTKS